MPAVVVWTVIPATATIMIATLLGGLFFWHRIRPERRGRALVIAGAVYYLCAIALMVVLFPR